MIYTAYDGPSLFDGARILLLVANVDAPSMNPKTGPMVQTYILRHDQTPAEALASRADASICGNCIHRGQDPSSRSCYVNMVRGPNRVFAAERSPKFDPRQLAFRHLRLGTYGDPAAIPFSIWGRLVRYSAGWTGYTHAWKTCDPRFKRLCMASVESIDEMRQAHALGWRTYRVIPKTAPLEKLDNETHCPAQSSGAMCIGCLACAGTSRQQNNIVAHAHGAAWITNNFEKNRPRPESDNGRLVA